MFEWHHLPYAGGIYDQDPRIMDGFRIIRRAIQHQEDLKEKREKFDRERELGKGARPNIKNPTLP